MTDLPQLKAPFPWFGGKSKVASLVWDRFGADIPNYVEPFAGSLAVLLSRPQPPRVETVNDIDCYLSNFWRSVSADAAGVAQWADWPVNEADLHARHLWLVKQTEFRERMKTDPDYFDVKVAGWWVWGLSQWIGGGWCRKPEWTGRAGCHATRCKGINADSFRTERKRPLMKRGGVGVHRTCSPLWQSMPDISGSRGASGRGLHSKGLADLYTYFDALQVRLRRVRVCCGDWQRILGPSPTWQIGVTAVFLDPPYAHDTGRDPDIYAQENPTLSAEVRAWALAHGDNPKLRIALCGYEGEHAMPADWECLAWKTNGGYGNQRAGQLSANACRERIWFSPYCLKPQRQPQLL